LFQFVNGTYTILDATTSGGGSDGPDLNMIRFLAPKIFSAQERAVTSSDYTALLLKNGYISNPSQVAVYGGDEINPPKYGRVFVSFPTGAGNPNEIVEFLREKNMITVIPEYIIPKTVDVVLNATAIVPSALSQSAKQLWKNKILNSFRNEFSTHTSGYAFGLQFDFDGWGEGIESEYGGSNGPIDGINFNKMHFVFGVEDAPNTTISFGTNLQLDDGDISNEFDLISGGTGKFKLQGTNITVNDALAGTWTANTNTITLNKLFAQHLQPRITLKSNIRNISHMNTIMTKFILNLAI